MNASTPADRLAEGGAAELVPAPRASSELSADLRAELLDLVAAMDDYAAAAQAANTTRAYSGDWRQFEIWCSRYCLAALPAEPQTAALYLTSLARRGLKLSTVRRRAAAITRAHRVAGLVSPVWDARVITVLEGIARTVGAAPRRRWRFYATHFSPPSRASTSRPAAACATARSSSSGSRSDCGDRSSLP